MHATDPGGLAATRLRAILFTVLIAAMVVVAALSHLLPGRVPDDGHQLTAISAVAGLATIAALMSCWAISGRTWPAYLSLALVPEWVTTEASSTRLLYDRPGAALTAGISAAAIAAVILAWASRQPQVDTGLRPLAIGVRLLGAIAIAAAVASALPRRWGSHDTLLGGSSTAAIWLVGALVCRTSDRGRACAGAMPALLAFGLGALARSFGMAASSETARSWGLTSGRALNRIGWLVLLSIAIEQLLAAHAADGNRQLSLRTARDGLDRDFRNHEREVDERDHDLRSLVAGIQGATSTLTRYRTHLKAGEQQQLEAALSAEISRLARSIEPAYLKRPDFSLRATLQPVLTSERLRGTILVDNLGQADLRVLGVADSAAAIVQNLITNARRHAPGAVVTISAGLTEDTVVISVCDDGPGLSTAARDQIGAVFASSVALWAGGLPEPRRPEVLPTWQTDHEHGLGLLICARLAVDQGGRMQLCDSETGTRIDVVLRRADGVAAGLSVAETTSF